MKSMLQKPYDLLEIKKFNIWGSVWISIFVLFFLWIFEPFGIYDLAPFRKFYVICIYVFSGLFIALIHQHFLLKIFIRKYTVGNTILWDTWIIVAIAGSVFINNALLFDEGRFYFSSFILALGIVTIIVIIPISIIVLLHYNFLLQKRIEKAKNINQLIQKGFKSNKKNKIISIEATNSKSKFSFFLDALIYIMAADNYVDIYYLVDDTAKHHLIRNTLTNVENQLSYIKEIKRCHKSYIINTGHVTSISGNSAGYKLKLDKIDCFIPVSRKYNTIIFESLNRKN